METSLPQLITFISTTIGLASIILIVAIRDFKNKTAKWFLLFASLVLIYVVTGFIDDLQSNLTIVLWMIRGELFVANFIPPAFLAFALAFSGYKFGKKWIRQVFYYFLIPLSVIAFLPNTVIDVVKNKYGTNVDNSGPLYYVTLVYFLVVLTYAFTILYKNAKNSDRVTKLQTALITFGLGTTVAINLVVVFLFPFFNLADIGNLIGAPSIIILAASLVYAVLGQHMFNIRALIVRTIGFFLMVGLLAGVFVAIILLLATSVVEGFDLQLNQYIFIISASVIAGMIFKPTADYLENKFNKLSASQSYNPQVVLNKVSATVSSTIDVDDLLVGVSEAITQNMGVRRVDSVVLGGGEVIYRSTDVNSYPSDEEFGVLGDENVNIDETSDQNKIAILRKYNISIYMVLKNQSEKLGYLMIGPKNNGLSYDSTDINTFINIAGQLSVTLKNIAYYFEVKSFNKTLQQRVDEATEKLRDANEKLKEADESKDDFISMASHQLSSPISSIEGYLSMANNGYLGELNPKLAEALKAAGGRTKVMKGIISDLLNVSHMTAGKFSLDLSPTDLAKIIEEEIKQSEPLAHQQQTEMAFHKPPQHIDDIMCDGPKIGQVVSNFITNALNYTPKGHVDVYLDKKPSGVEVRVVDDGIGVPTDQQAKLFQKFFRADNAKKERPSGNGIGLYVAKKVIEEHGGKIIFQSTQGHGSTFGFVLPIQAVNKATVEQSDAVKEPANEQASPPEAVSKDVV